MVAVPDELTAEYIATRWPRLFHMAESGTWSSIQQHGLLSTSALLDLFEIEGDERESIESVRRAESVTISHDVYGSVVIRDNKPINETVLRRTLDGMSLAEWYRLLNGRVFFWLNQSRLDRLRNAGEYRDRRHDVLTIDTAALLENYGSVVELSPMNSGAVHAGAKYRRGRYTFSRVPDYPWAARVRANRLEPIVELTVPAKVPDIASFVLDVSTR